VHLAHEHGRGDEAKERLLRAYFAEGELMSDHDSLVRMAAEVGLDEDEVRGVIAGDGHAAAVRDDERTAMELGITAVPTFVIDRAIGVSGAQPPAALLEFLRQGWSSRRAEPAGSVEAA
jgi:predicted DsbA family dithiol-disulfide isomerase